MTNTYIFRTDDPVELARLLHLDRTLTHTMGGPLAGLPLLPEGATLLDLGCGPGGWVLDAAFERKDCEVTGVDSSENIISYARTRASSQLRCHAGFQTLDITTCLPFADATFDLINARFLVAALKREAWAPLLAQCLRLLRPGGLLRVTEPVDLGEGSSLAAHRLSALCCQVLCKAGYGFSPDGSTLGLTARLPALMRQAGIAGLHLHSYALDISKGEPGWEGFYHNLHIGGYLIQPLLVEAHLCTQAEAQELYEHALIETYLPDFCGVWQWLSVWGHKPESGTRKLP